MTVHEWLLRIREMDEMINAKQAEKKRLRELATSATGKPYDGMPRGSRGGVSRRVEDAAVLIVQAEQEINRMVEKYLRQRGEAIAILERLPVREYKILHRYYIQGQTLEKIAEETGYCVAQVWRIKKAGLERLEGLRKQKK